MSSIIKKLRCVACHHEWFPKSPEPPICCPKCRRADWKDGKGPRSIAAVKRRIAAKAEKRAMLRDRHTAVNSQKIETLS